MQGGKWGSRVKYIVTHASGTVSEYDMMSDIEVQTAASEVKAG